MIDKIMPFNCLRQLQFQKYKTALLPIVVIMTGFILKLGKVEIPFIQYILAISLVAYLFVLFIFRLGKPNIPEMDNILVSPANGKILSIEKVNGMVKIRIAKSFFDPIELRCPVFMPGKADDSEVYIQHGDNEIEMSFGNRTPHFFHEPGTVQGSLLGILKGSFIITIIFNENILKKEIEIKQADILVAGETILAELKEPVTVS